ncbi:MAG: phosphoribosyltransferase family protein [bacterium]
MLSHEEVMVKFAEVGAVITNSHLVYTSGRHGSAYVDKDAIYPFVEVTSALCQSLVDVAVKDELMREATVIIGPERGGIILSQWTACHLAQLTGNVVLGVYAEKSDEGGAFLIKPRWLKHVQGKRALVVEDVLTTGGSARKVVELVQTTGGLVQGVIALCNRGGVAARDLNVPRLYSLVEVNLESWEEADCPLCRDGVPINTQVGHGKEFLDRQKRK